MYSIITINYNNAMGLEHTFRSVFSQSCHNYEYIVIDGGSTDSSLDVIKRYADKITYWVSEMDRGIYHAMNKGVVQAHGEYCLFMNSGDCFYDEYVLERIEALKCKEEIFVGKVVAGKDEVLMSPPPKRDVSLYHLYSGAIPHQGAFIHTDLLRKFPYDESLKISADWKFFVQAIIFENCSFRYVEENVSRYDTEGISSSNPKLMWMEKEQVLRDFFPSRLLSDYQYMKASECQTQMLAPQLRVNYGIDKILYRIGKFLLKCRRKING